MSRASSTDPLAIPTQSLPLRLRDEQWPGLGPPRSLSDLAESDEEGDLRPRRGSDHDWLLDDCDYSRTYGTSPSYSYQRRPQPNLLQDERRRKRRRNFHSTTIASIGSLDEFVGRYRSDSSDEEQPPIIQMIYRRSPKDLIKLFLLPSLYLLFMAVAMAFAFYTIQGLVLSYNNHVQSVRQTKVEEAYDPIGIVIMPQFSSYNGCAHRYYDNLSPNNMAIENCSNSSLPTTCTMTNVKYKSEPLGVYREAMVFQSPTLVYCKQSLALMFEINTTAREFSSVEYMLFYDWENFTKSSYEDKQQKLSEMERDSIIYTFPSGFRTWVKMSYSLTFDTDNKAQEVQFFLINNYATYTSVDSTEEMYPMEVIFEWASPYYTKNQMVISTTIFSAIGSMCGVAVTLIKAGEFCRQLIRRIRREKQKKLLHLQELERKQSELMEEYEKRKKERRETKKAKMEESFKKDLRVNL